MYDVWTIVQQDVYGFTVYAPETDFADSFYATLTEAQNHVKFQLLSTLTPNTCDFCHETFSSDKLTETIHCGIVCETCLSSEIMENISE